MIEDDAKKVVEAVLFSTAELLTPTNLADIVGNTTAGHVRLLVEGLNLDYERSGRTFRIMEVAGGYQMRTLPTYRAWVQKSEPLKPVRLTQPALEILAIVAYRQPVTRADVEHLRGVDCSHGLRALLERKLVRIVGKDKAPGRPILYGTTREFLSLFNLPDLRDLPTPEEFDLPPPPEVAEESPLQELVPGSENPLPPPPPLRTQTDSDAEEETEATAKIDGRVDLGQTMPETAPEGGPGTSPEPS